jgi:hypothetical protein
MNEVTFLAHVTQLAQERCLRWHHCRDGRKCRGSGFPDLVIVGPGGALFRELKVPGGLVRIDQRRWIWEIRDSGGDAGIWTPRELTSGLIASELDRIAGLGEAAA